MKYLFRWLGYVLRTLLAIMWWGGAGVLTLIYLVLHALWHLRLDGYKTLREYHYYITWDGPSEFLFDIEHGINGYERWKACYTTFTECVLGEVHYYRTVWGDEQPRQIHPKSQHHLYKNDKTYEMAETALTTTPEQEH